MTTYRIVTLGRIEEDGSEVEDILVVPDSTTTEDLMLDPENAPVICACFSDEWAVLIADLLNKFDAKMGMN